MLAKLVLIAASALLLSRATAVAQIQADDQITQTVRVGYSDLDVNTDAGAKTLLARVKTAAGDACGGEPFFDSRYGRMPDAVRAEFTACRKRALAQAVAGLAIPRLSAAYADSKHAAPIREAAR